MLRHDLTVLCVYVEEDNSYIQKAMSYGPMGGRGGGRKMREKIRYVADSASCSVENKFLLRRRPQKKRKEKKNKDTQN